MSKRLQLAPHTSTEELEHRYKEAKDPVERSHRQIMWLLSEGRTTTEVGKVTGYSPGWVRRIARRYNERGVEGLGDRRHSDPGAKGRALLDEAGEAELLEALQEPPSASLGGGMWRAGDPEQAAVFAQAMMQTVEETMAAGEAEHVHSHLPQELAPLLARRPGDVGLPGSGG